MTPQVIKSNRTSLVVSNTEEFDYYEALEKATTNLVIRNVALEAGTESTNHFTNHTYVHYLELSIGTFKGSLEYIVSKGQEGGLTPYKNIVFVTNNYGLACEKLEELIENYKAAGHTV